MKPLDDLQTRRILVVEDNFLVSMSIANMLRQFGCEVLGPVPSVEEGLALVHQEAFDAAVLDINITGGTCAPIAEALRERGLPFIFVTGYASPSVLPESLSSVRRIEKPLDLEAFHDLLADTLG